MKTINRFWYSNEQDSLFNGVERPKINKVLCPDGVWRQYSEWTSRPEGKCNWKDAKLVAEFPEGVNSQIKMTCLDNETPYGFYLTEEIEELLEQ